MYQLKRSLSDSKGGCCTGLTGYGQDEDRDRARAVGFDGHLVKPMEFKRLSERSPEQCNEQDRRDHRVQVVAGSGYSQ